MSTSARRRTNPDGVLESHNPATGEVIGTASINNVEQVNAAVSRAQEAFLAWSALSHGERREQLDLYRRRLAAHAEELAELIHLENGKPKIDAANEVFMSLSHLQHAAQRAEKATREHSVSSGLMANIKATVSYHPLGVVGVIGPWNYPMITPFGSIAYALAAGNSVVFKPSELTPLVGQRFVEIANECMSVPDVLQVVTGDGNTGAALASANVDKLSFTGSPRTGRRVMAAAAENLTPVLLELGGKDAMIVSEDADVERAAHDAVYGALSNAGQACVSIERCYVVASVHQAFVAAVKTYAADITWGEDIGPITMASQVDIIRKHMEDAVQKGATVLLGGPEGIQGNFVPATVLSDCRDNMLIMREETFGPVLAIAKVSDTDEAIARANESSYGLGSAVFSKKRGKDIADKLRSGMSSVNSVLTFSTIPSLPFGGMGESGFGRIHGDEGIREFSRIKSTAEERFTLPVNMMSFDLPKNSYERVLGMIKQVYGGGIVDRVRGKLGR